MTNSRLVIRFPIASAFLAVFRARCAVRTLNRQDRQDRKGLKEQFPRSSIYDNRLH